MSLTQDLRWSLGRSIALQLQRQIDLLLCTINCFLQWDHLPNMAVGDLAFYYTLYLWILHIQIPPDQLHRSRITKYQAPDSETSLTPVFFSSTCFRLSGAAQQQLGFLNFTSGSVWKWRLQWRNSGSPIERSVAQGTLIDAPRYASTWKQRKRRLVRGVLRGRSNAHSVRKYKMAALWAMSDQKCCSPFPCLFIPESTTVTSASWRTFWGYAKGYSAATVTGVSAHAVAAVYPRCTFKGPNCRSHRSTALDQKKKKGCLFALFRPT